MGLPGEHQAGWGAPGAEALRREGAGRTVVFTCARPSWKLVPSSFPRTPTPTPIFQDTKKVDGDKPRPQAMQATADPSLLCKPAGIPLLQQLLSASPISPDTHVGKVQPSLWLAGVSQTHPRPHVLGMAGPVTRHLCTPISEVSALPLDGP